MKIDKSARQLKNYDMALQSSLKYDHLSKPFKYPKPQPSGENCLKCLMYDDW